MSPQDYGEYLYHMMRDGAFLSMNYYNCFFLQKEEYGSTKFDENIIHMNII